MKKPIYIGYFSFFQLAVIFILSVTLVPIIGVYGPLIAFFVMNTILAIYAWVIVGKHYWGSE